MEGIEKSPDAANVVQSSLAYKAANNKRPVSNTIDDRDQHHRFPSDLRMYTVAHMCTYTPRVK